MLKIKDDVDLKELEKFGFKLRKLDLGIGKSGIGEFYCLLEKNFNEKYGKLGDVTYSFCVEFYINQNREIDFCAYPDMRNEIFILDTLFDLIKAGLVEKVDE